MPKSKDGLGRYYAKRSADDTPEPFGGVSGRHRVFVVQKHAATRMHYDLRLEMQGVLKSWAVPRGASFDPAIKRLAVRTEDHPLDYVDFEGVIPPGNYGAGAMIVWDRGTWIPHEEPIEGMKKGKLLFELKGYKLRGVFTLVKTKGENDEWLLIKKTDGWARPDDDKPVPQASILSGLTVEELGEGRSRVDEMAKEIAQLDLPESDIDLGRFQCMLAETADEAFSKKGWIYELKYDGYRLLCLKRDGQVRFHYRSGIDATNQFPDLARALKALPLDDVILDGEVVVLDDGGKPIFQRLQKRVQLARAIDVERATSDYPATYFSFDLLRFAGLDLTGLPLLERKRILQHILPPTGLLRYSDHIEQQGEAFYEGVRNMGLEGIVAKKADSPYRNGRSPDWKKIRIERSDEFVVVGFTRPKTSNRTGFSGLHLARYAGRDLVYAGRVGSGFDQKTLKELSAQLESIIIDKPALSTEGILQSSRSEWVKPELVCGVRYLHRTDEGYLRHPVFLGIRVDKSADDLMEPELDPVFYAPEAPTHEPEARKVPFTNLQKIFWPEEGYTKGDLIDYYRQVSRFIVPYLEDRPVVLTRYPDGIDGKNFFQKDAPPFIPGWLRTERMYSEHAQREIDYFVCDDEASLLYVVNMGSIPLHVWSSRVAQLQHPDWTILDLDPKGAPFSDVVTLALSIKKLADDLGLPSFVKTSGSTGLHVLVPLAGQCTYVQSRTFAELMARVIVSEHPKIATVARHIPSREGRVYVDFGQNGHGRLLVSPLCVRPRPHAPVSVPLFWEEVGPDLNIDDHTIKTVPKRLEFLESKDLDPWSELFELKPDLQAALERLATRLSA